MFPGGSEGVLGHLGELQVLWSRDNICLRRQEADLTTGWSETAWGSQAGGSASPSWYQQNLESGKSLKTGAGIRFYSNIPADSRGKNRSDL